jgi:hypothetical protein
VVLRLFVVQTDLMLLAFFLFDIFTLFVGQVGVIFTKNRHKDILRLVGEIDEKIKNELQMSSELTKNNVKMQRKIVVTWIIYSILTIYYPISRIVKNDFSTLFFDSIFRILAWSFLVHINLTKFLYFFSLLSVRLEVIKNCLRKIQDEEKIGKILFLRLIL